mmetsp:Transcript_42402/g.64170  ORF Transcript_42402/g.64170 Transcript_42402/m.64170 type:complete len:513 (+) Transcript_42402:271-1809(+)
MSQGLDTKLSLLSLDEADVGLRTLGGILAREEVDAQRVRVEAGQGDELPAETHLSQVPNEGFHLGIRHASTVPVEGRRQVVCKHLVRHSGSHLSGELFSLGDDGFAGFHPDAVRIRSPSDGSLNAEFGAALDPVVALDAPGSIPVEEHLHTHFRGSLLHLGHGHLQGVLQPLGRVSALGLQCLGDGIRESHAAGSLLPVLVLASSDGLIQRLNSLRCHTLNEGMVDGVDVGVNHGRSFGISSGHEDERRVQDVGLQTDGDEALAVLPSGHQNLAAHVAALLGAWFLILDVDAGGTIFDEHFCEFHCRGKTSVASVGVGNDRVEVVDRLGLGPHLGGHAASLLILLPVMEELGSEKLVHLVGNSVVRVVGDVGSRLVGSGGSGAALPARDVHSGQVLGHLSNLDGVQSTEGVGASALGLMVPHHVVQFGAQFCRGEIQWEGALHLHNILRSVRSGRVLEPLAIHPRLHCLHSGIEIGVLGRAGAAHFHTTADGGIAGEHMLLDPLNSLSSHSW